MKKTEKSIFTLVMILIVGIAYSQNKIQYSYDNVGNRVLRNICTTCRIAHNPSVATDTTTQTDIQIAAVHGANLFPNPTQDKITLTLNNLQDGEPASVVVTDEIGKILFTQNNLQAQNEINMNAYNVGMYFVKVTVGKDVLLYKVLRIQ